MRQKMANHLVGMVPKHLKSFVLIWGMIRHVSRTQSEGHPVGAAVMTYGNLCDAHVGSEDHGRGTDDT